MTKLWTRFAGMMVAGAVLMGSSVAVLAAPADSPKAQKAEKAPEIKELKHLRDQIKGVHEKVVSEREQLKGNRATIKELVQQLKQDPDKNKKQLEIARVDLRELKLLLEDRQQVKDQLKAARQDFKAAVEAKDVGAATRAAERVMSLMQTKLDILRAANNKAAQVIAHLKAAD